MATLKLVASTSLLQWIFMQKGTMLNLSIIQLCTSDFSAMNRSHEHDRKNFWEELLIFYLQINKVYIACLHLEFVGCSSQGPTICECLNHFGTCVVYIAGGYLPLKAVLIGQLWPVPFRCRLISRQKSKKYLGFRSFGQRSRHSCYLKKSKIHEKQK